MRWVTKRRVRAVAVLAVVVAAVAVFEAARLQRVNRWNEAIAAGRVPAEFSASKALAAAPPQVRFVEAAGQAASGADEAALNHYRALQEEAAVGTAARYNSANLLLRQALRLRESSQPGQAIPLIELAKETYREILRDDPSQWNARYNLERAQRLLPEPEESDIEPPDLARNAERAVTTMRGYSPGLP